MQPLHCLPPSETVVILTHLYTLLVARHASPETCDNFLPLKEDKDVWPINPTTEITPLVNFHNVSASTDTYTNIENVYRSGDGMPNKVG